MCDFVGTFVLHAGGVQCISCLTFMLSVVLFLRLCCLHVWQFYIHLSMSFHISFQKKSLDILTYEQVFHVRKLQPGLLT